MSYVGPENIRLDPEIGQPTWVELITAVVEGSAVRLHRELADPSYYRDVLALALAHSTGEFDWTPYWRKAGTAEPIEWSAGLETGMSLLLVRGDPAPVLAQLALLPEVLPTRMVW